MNYIYLSRRNLLTLLSKLDRVKNGEESARAIVKYDDQHKEYPTTCAPVVVAALEDEEYYTDRPPGGVLSADIPPKPECPPNIIVREDQPLPKCPHLASNWKKEYVCKCGKIMDGKWFSENDK